MMKQIHFLVLSLLVLQCTGTRSDGTDTMVINEKHAAIQAHVNEEKSNHTVQSSPSDRHVEKAEQRSEEYDMPESLIESNTTSDTKPCPCHSRYIDCFAGTDANGRQFTYQAFCMDICTERNTCRPCTCRDAQ
eukprot:gnl/TRDRNA2_/TRDRNA2_40449_c0_seq1.p1 gnl/TRDRNA2_/TRDRNA2_40449_c0~~gnl/TRDRNA2_/TRDRNA2_40449_c0_seq1.p1  ORF type:complete len:133 (+),score=18.04 gnl/TRDRNA2_/TRDRNA2_40449_c0_seq1:34-432(+)